MSKTGFRTMLAACAAMGLAGQAMAGEFQLAFRLGEDQIKIDGDRLSSGNGVSEGMVNIGLLASYRWTNGAYVEAGLAGSGNFDILGINDVSHRWIGGGWQMDVANNWYLTPKLGLTWSHLTSSEEDLFDSEPVDRFSDVVPFIELAVEHRFGDHIGIGAYLRHTFEDWGSSSDVGLSLSWTFL
jgi:outer membrane protein with beta-barrel domain